MDLKLSGIKITSFGLLRSHKRPPEWREKTSKCPSGCSSKEIGDEKKKN